MTRLTAWLRCAAGIHTYQHAYEHVLTCARCGHTATQQRSP